MVSWIRGVLATSAPQETWAGPRTPNTANQWATFVRLHGGVKMESSEDLAHTPRHDAILGMFISKYNRPMCNPRYPRHLYKPTGFSP